MMTIQTLLHEISKKIDLAGAVPGQLEEVADKVDSIEGTLAIQLEEIRAAVAALEGKVQAINN